MTNQLDILYEDNHIIAVNKRVSDIVQADKTGDVSLEEQVKAYIKEKYNKPGDVFLGVPHRVDRPVSGVVLFARTSKALVRLNKMFQDHEESVKKIYWAIVGQMPEEEEATLVHYLRRDGEKNKSHAYNQPKPVCTGRHHQIRCQLARIGCPIKGDLKYGAPSSNEGGGISLHARSISFIHPVRQEPLTITATPPLEDALWKFFYEHLK